MRMNGVMELDTRAAFVNVVDCAASMGSRVVLFGLKIISIACGWSVTWKREGRGE